MQSTNWKSFALLPIVNVKLQAWTVKSSAFLRERDNFSFVLRTLENLTEDVAKWRHERALVLGGTFRPLMSKKKYRYSAHTWITLYKYFSITEQVSNPNP